MLTDGRADKASPGKDDLTAPLIELKARRRNGEEFPVELTLASRKRMAGWLPTTTLIIRDITERKRTEAALRESEQRWATTLASIGDAVIASDIEGRITYMNAVAEELTGWILADAFTKPVIEVFNIINEYTRAEVDNPVTKVLKEGTIVGLANHTILVRKDGTEVPIDDSGAPIRDRDGKIVGVVLVFRDITERKRAEEALRESEERFRVAQELSPDGFSILRPLRDEHGAVVDFTWVYANATAERFTGKALRELCGRRLLEIFPATTGRSF